MGIDDVDLDDELLDGDEPQHTLPEGTEEDKHWIEPEDVNAASNIATESTDGEPVEEDEDLISLILKNKGINPDSIKIENESGIVEEIKFADLPKSEQLEILNSNPQQAEYGLDDEEISLINELRNNNLSVQDFVNYHKQKAIEEYLSQQDTVQQFDVDAYSDDELFIADLKAKIPDLTDEEALQQLNTEKSNESLFTKKINGLRDTYKLQEQQLTEQAEQEQAEKDRQAAAEYEDIIAKTIQENDTIDFGDSVLSLSNDDMNQIASFILDSDPAGVRYIAKALQDPKTMVKMAWFACKGDEAMTQISNYYKRQISEVGKTNYQKGYADAKSGKVNSKTIVRKPSGTQPNKVQSINDIDDI